MPNSLTDILDTLNSHSHQLHDLSTSTSTAHQPLAGRFTRAYLQGTNNILEIIREAQPHERSLFSYIGEGDVLEGQGKGNEPGGGNPNAGAGGGMRGKIVHKRSVGLSTPLRKVQKPVNAGRKGGEVDAWEDPVKLLNAALTLVEE